MTPLLVVLTTWSLTRLVVTDDISAPLRAWAIERSALLEELVTCPFCVSFWIAAGVVVSLVIAEAVGLVWLWQWIVAPFAIRIIVGHLSMWLD